MHRFAVVSALALMTVLGACASMSDNATSVLPVARPVDKDKLYLGVWHEIARNPMNITNGCVAGETRFTTDDSGVLIDRDSCRMGDANTGKEKVFQGPVSFPEPGNAAHFHTQYKVFGPFTAGRDYIVLDHAADYSWFIVATPSFKDLSIFTRDPQAPQSVKDELTARAKALGYDVTKLEYPSQPRA